MAVETVGTSTDIIISVITWSSRIIVLLTIEGVAKYMISFCLWLYKISDSDYSARSAANTSVSTTTRCQHTPTHKSTTILHKE